MKYMMWGAGVAKWAQIGWNIFFPLNLPQMFFLVFLLWNGMSYTYMRVQAHSLELQKGIKKSNVTKLEPKEPP